ncbi:MAG TPA: hypothetical protein VE968_10165 [Sphingomicrobium sp.]|nr:hypothetical protein [Sphingomicrobium sp.]
MDGKIHDEPSSVASDHGTVVVDGPDAVAVTLTPDAAEETGERLISSAIEAAAYRHRDEAATKRDASASDELSNEASK